MGNRGYRIADEKTPRYLGGPRKECVNYGLGRLAVLESADLRVVRARKIASLQAQKNPAAPG